jgi:hypothetical protein
MKKKEEYKNLGFLKTAIMESLSFLFKFNYKKYPLKPSRNWN